MQKKMGMQAVASPVENSRKMLWAGRGLTGLVVLFMAFDGVTKVTRAPQVLKAMVELGFAHYRIPLAFQFEQSVH
jgi:DoxX-like family